MLVGVIAGALVIVGVYVMALLGWAGRLSCLAGRHHWHSPAMTYGENIPPAYQPRPDDGAAAVIQKFRDYTTMRCTRCPKRYSL